jgi:hypothetical protein
MLECRLVITFLRPQKRKVKFSLRLINLAPRHRNVSGSGGIAPPFFTSALDGGEWSAPGAFGAHWRGGWAGLRVSKEEYLAPPVQLADRSSSPWPESASELYRPSDHRLSVNCVPTFADKECHVVRVTDPYGRILGFSRPEPLLFLPSSSSIVLTRLSGSPSIPTTTQKIW